MVAALICIKFSFENIAELSVEINSMRYAKLQVDMYYQYKNESNGSPELMDFHPYMFHNCNFGYYYLHTTVLSQSIMQHGLPLSFHFLHFSPSLSFSFPHLSEDSVEPLPV